MHACQLIKCKKSVVKKMSCVKS